ncbi:MAG: hypothetical protein M3Q03_14300 [Chloroflexota bacterium]|nr:hypothetical protein [Chloroflexota bacterium]
MPQALSDGRPDNPVFTVMDAVPIAAGGNALSDHVPCSGHERAAIAYSIDQSHTRLVHLSDDGVTFYTLAASGPNVDYGGGTLSTASRSLTIDVAGARFLRVAITNAGAALATATAKVMLG